MIKPIHKDLIVDAIIAANTDFIELKHEDIFPNHDIQGWEFMAIIKQMEQKYLLCNVTYLSDNTIFVEPTANLFDLYNRGGFVVQEEILKTNIEKLGYELDSLKDQLSPYLVDKVEKIAKIASAITSVLSLFPK